MNGKTLVFTIKRFVAVSSFFLFPLSTRANTNLTHFRNEVDFFWHHSNFSWLLTMVETAWLRRLLNSTILALPTPRQAFKCSSVITFTLARSLQIAFTGNPMRLLSAYYRPTQPQCRKKIFSYQQQMQSVDANFLQDPNFLAFMLSIIKIFGIEYTVCVMRFVSAISKSTTEHFVKCKCTLIKICYNWYKPLRADDLPGVSNATLRTRVTAPKADGK